MKRAKSVRDFDFYIDEYMYNCQSRKLRRKTLVTYEQTLRLFERWCLDAMGITSPEEVREATFRRYICDLQERGKYTFYSVEEAAIGYSPNKRRDYGCSISVTSINNYIRNLKAFFAWYARYTSLPNPVSEVKELKNERKAREYLEDEEIEKLMKSFDKGLYKEHRDSMIIMLLMDTGMRLGECLKIKVEDVDMTERTICLPAENTKGRKTRFVFFSVTTARCLQRWLRFKDRYACGAYLFCGKSGLPFEVHSFETNFKRYLLRAGIDKEYTPHALRNNFAKRCLMNGMDIYTLSRILGHSSVTVTEKAYLDLNDRDLRNRYQNFSPIENMRK